MFRVPVDPENPTFDQTERITFRRWLTSTAEERREWTRRRNAAAKLAQANREAKLNEHTEQMKAKAKEAAKKAGVDDIRVGVIFPMD
jgi:ferric-dicitrate binding protein FerR (iron transport regulator)